MIKFWTKTISLAFFICALTIACVGNIAQAQNIDQTTNWDQNKAELQITSPISTQIEVGQDFYLRYLQNLKSFEATSKIDWKITNSNQNIVYQRQIVSNQDKNEVVKIQNPGYYHINLKLQIGAKNIEITRKLEIIPKDIEYYKGLEFSEISLTKSQIELWNNSDKDIDASALFFDYNGNQGHQNLGKINIIPAGSFAVFELNPKINPKKISLNFEKNLRQKTVEVVAVFDQENLLKIPANPDQSLQFNSETQLWAMAKSSLGQKNTPSFSKEIVQASGKSNALPNFQRIKTPRTGGMDQKSMINLIPFLLIFIIFILSLIFEKFEILYQNSRFKFMVFWLNCQSQIEFYVLARLILFKAV